MQVVLVTRKRTADVVVGDDSVLTPSSICIIGLIILSFIPLLVIVFFITHTTIKSHNLEQKLKKLVGPLFLMLFLSLLLLELYAIIVTH